jgi:hypothetical protein
MVASGEPTDAIKEATSWGPLASGVTLYADGPFGLCELDAFETVETVESMDGFRGIIGCWWARAVVALDDVRFILGETGGVVFSSASTGTAVSLRRALDWSRAAGLEASSLSTSRVTAVRRSSTAGLAGTRLPGLGARTRSTSRGRPFAGNADVPAAATAGGDAPVVCVACEGCCCRYGDGDGDDRAGAGGALVLASSPVASCPAGRLPWPWPFTHPRLDISGPWFTLVLQVWPPARYFKLSDSRCECRDSKARNVSASAHSTDYGG